MQRLLNWSSIPGIAASSLVSFYSLSRLLNPIFTRREIFYIFKKENSEVFLWAPILYAVFAIGILYITIKKSKVVSYTLFTVCTGVLISKLRFGTPSSDRNAITLLFSFIFLQVVITRHTKKKIRKDKEMLGSGVDHPFTGVAVVAYCLLAAGTAAIILSVLFVKTSPLVAMTHDPTPAIAFLVGGEESYYDARVQFWAVAIGIVFLAVVTETTRYREVQWLATLTAVVNIGSIAFLWRQNPWTATVTAVGALLAVITLALVLDERTEATLS